MDVKTYRSIELQAGALPIRWLSLDYQTLPTDFFSTQLVDKDTTGIGF